MQLLIAAVIAVGGPSDAANAFQPAQPPPPHQADVLCGHARANARQIELDNGAPPPQHGLNIDALSDDVLHYNLDLEIIPSSNTLIGTNIITVRSLVNNLTTFPLQLHQNFAISLLQVNGVNVSYIRQDVANLLVNLDHPYNVNDQFDVKISYSGVPVSGGFGSINFSTQGGQPLVFTLSEPYYAYTWWPVKEDNRDKATADLAFTVPNTMKVASNGLRQGIDTIPSNRLRYRWKTNFQTSPYLLCFGATNYNEFTDLWTYPTAPPGGMLMQFFIYPGSDTQSNRNAWLATKQMLTTESELFGTYPFAGEKYGIYQFGFGGGMEHQTMTGQGTFSASTTAHELGHQWWGDRVTCASWGHIWLHEGFATYTEALWAEFQPGSSGTPALLSAMSNRRPASMDTIVYRYNTSSASVIFDTSSVYYKGAWVLHMLRHIMGDAAFFQTLRNYGDQFAGGTATTEDLQAVAESVYGGDLSWFFQPWVYLTGAPTYQTAWRNVSAGGGNYVELYIKQVQNAAWTTFKMPIDIVTTISGTPTTKRVWNDERAEHLLIPVSGTVSSVAVDPNNYILHPSNQTTTFVEGPPKIVKVLPLPGSESAPGVVSAVNVTFHKNVNAAAGQFAIIGANAGSIPFTFSYAPATLTATLTPTSPLAADTYTLTVSAALTDVAAGLALDGEIIDPNSPAALPSGDGLPGGAAIVSFKVVAPCPADSNHDNVVNVSDLLAVINAWGPCAGCAADLNSDGLVNVSDLLAVINAWGSCP